jgi:hypothetical protein
MQRLCSCVFSAHPREECVRNGAFDAKRFSTRPSPKPKPKSSCIRKLSEQRNGNTSARLQPNCHHALTHANPASVSPAAVVATPVTTMLPG